MNDIYDTPIPPATADAPPMSQEDALRLIQDRLNQLIEQFEIAKTHLKEKRESNIINTKIENLISEHSIMKAELSELKKCLKK